MELLEKAGRTLVAAEKAVALAVQVERQIVLAVEAGVDALLVDLAQRVHGERGRLRRGRSAEKHVAPPEQEARAGAAESEALEQSKVVRVEHADSVLVGENVLDALDDADFDARSLLLARVESV